jgi:hypothetical protein
VSGQNKICDILSRETSTCALFLVTSDVPHVANPSISVLSNRAIVMHQTCVTTLCRRVPLRRVENTLSKRGERGKKCLLCLEGLRAPPFLPRHNYASRCSYVSFRQRKADHTVLQNVAAVKVTVQGSRHHASGRPSGVIFRMFDALCLSQPGGATVIRVSQDLTVSSKIVAG